jgi:hypothetical protein
MRQGGYRTLWLCAGEGPYNSCAPSTVLQSTTQPVTSGPGGDQWYHVVVLRRQGTEFIYINGQFENSRATDGSIGPVAEPLSIGRGTSQGGGGVDIALSDSGR